MYLCGTRYKVTGRLGEGGFGKVYLAEDRLLKKTWAIKEIGEYTPAAYDAAKAEISVLAKVSHPGIVRITDLFRSENSIYIVMDHVRGMDLKALMRSGLNPSEKLIYRWSIELCDAVSYLHDMDPPVILRDIKPQNIMVKPDGHIVLIDFGAAMPDGYDGGKGDIPVFASIRYAAPEQLTYGNADVRSDICAIGHIIDEISGRKRPFGMSYIVRKCTMKDPAMRYKSAASVKAHLLFSRSIGWIGLAAAAILVAGILFLSKANDSTLRMNERAQADQAYEKALMCFYELGDYHAASGYLDGVPEEMYPEKKYYVRLLEMLSSKDTDNSAVEDSLLDFSGYNEDVVRHDDAERYIKNIFCIAKVYISLGGEKGYDSAYSLVKGLLDEGGNDSIYKSYEADAIRLLINILTLEGRAYKENAPRKEKYHEAIGYIERLVLLPDVKADEEYVISRYMDEAALYTETGELALAVKVYERTEASYPLSPHIKYFAHLSLLFQSDATSSEIKALWDMIKNVDGITENSGYDIMRERVEAIS